MSATMGKQKINIFPGRNYTKTFNILSIGQRGVGKTVFLMGTYAELQAHHLTQHPQKLWFDCQNEQVEENIEKIFHYVVQTNQYPPPTMKIMNFSFSLKQQGWLGEQTLCHFRWNDIPGEICDVHNLDFRNMVLSSHGCCVFIDAYALRHSDNYLQVLDNIFEQVMALTSLVYLNGLKYPLALILTKSDLIEPSSLSQQIINNKLQPLTSHLDAVKSDYQIFHSSIPLTQKNGTATLEAKGAAVSLLWLVWQLNKIHNPGLDNQMLSLLNRILPSSNKLSRQEPPNGTMEPLFNSTAKVGVKKASAASLLPNLKYGLFLAIGSMGLILILLLGYQRFFPAGSNDINTINKINTLQKSGQLNGAAVLLEQLIQRQPQRIDLRLQLAQLYELQGNITKAETAYDQTLAKQKDNLKALVGKAGLRQLQNDPKNADALFEQAEKVAPDALKSQVRAVAKNSFNEPAKQPNSK
jgi:tetratricopeptide (TPR) repeat protein